MTVAPIELDGVLFVSHAADHESAFCQYSGFEIGEIGFDDEHRCHKARKQHGLDMTPWRLMRCLPEARAFIVSRIRTQ